MSALNSPCQGCEDRCIGCHTTCGDYANYKKELEEVRARQIAENAEIEFSRAVKDACLRKAMKKRK